MISAQKYHNIQNYCCTFHVLCYSLSSQACMSLFRDHDIIVFSFRLQTGVVMWHWRVCLCKWLVYQISNSIVDCCLFSLHCTLASCMQCIVIGPVCGWVCGWVCYHDNSKLSASILTKLGWFVGKGTISSWLNFGHPAPPGRGLRCGENFWLHLTIPAHSVCVSLSAFFIALLLSMNTDKCTTQCPIQMHYPMPTQYHQVSSSTQIPWYQYYSNPCINRSFQIQKCTAAFYCEIMSCWFLCLVFRICCNVSHRSWQHCTGSIDLVYVEKRSWTAAWYLFPTRYNVYLRVFSKSLVTVLY